MGHKLKVVDEISLFLGRVELEVLQLRDEDVEVDLELFQVLVWLSLDLVLQLSQCHGFFISVH